MIFPIIIIVVCILGGAGAFFFINGGFKKTGKSSGNGENTLSPNERTDNKFLNIKDIRDKYLYTADGT